MKTINKAYKIRIYPNKQQQELINKTIGSSRFVYNYFLDERIELYNSDKETSGYFKDCKKLAALKKKEDTIWLKEVDKFALESSLKDLDNAYKNFFRRIKQGNNKLGFPKFKSKHTAIWSYRTTFTNNNIEIKDSRIKLPKLRWIKFRDKRDLSNISKIFNVTISKTRSGRYYASVCVEETVNPKESTGAVVGVDLGLKEFLVTSDGLFVESPNYLRSSEDKLKKLQRQHSKKQKGSKNREKSRLKLAKLHEKIANQRKYFLQVLSSKLISENQVISLETLKVKNMLQNGNLAKSISDAGWYEFTRQLGYKGEWNSRNVVQIDTFYPSSQLCSRCGNKSSQTKDLSVRTYICSECGLEMDRDLNAAINIREEGLRVLGS